MSSGLAFLPVTDLKAIMLTSGTAKDCSGTDSATYNMGMAANVVNNPGFLLCINYWVIFANKQREMNWYLVGWAMKIDNRYECRTS